MFEEVHGNYLYCRVPQPRERIELQKNRQYCGLTYRRKPRKSSLEGRSERYGQFDLILEIRGCFLQQGAEIRVLR